MSRRRYSGRRYCRRRSPLPALLLVIVLAALVLGALAIFTDIFKKDTPADKSDEPVVTQPGDTQTSDDTQTPDNGDGQTGTAPDDTQQTTGNKTVDTITTDATPYQTDSVYVVGSSGFEMYNYVDSLAKSYADIVTAVADQLSGTSTVYTLAVPLSSGITLPDALYSDIPGSDQAQAEKDILAAMGNNVKTVPLHDMLMSHRSEYIYFRTDHHWTALGAYYAYREFCGAKGITPHSLSEYEVSQFDGFLGSFYNDAGKPDVMKNDPDTVTAYHPISTEARMQYVNKKTGNENDELTPGKVIYDESDAAASLKYGTFITGDNPYTVIENPDLSDGSKCVVVKESFGNAFVPFLVDHYQTVYVIDYRYYSGSVSDFAKTNGVTDVIFINNLSAIRGSYQMGKLAGVK